MWFLGHLGASYWPKDRHIEQWDVFEGPELNFYMYGQLMFHKGVKTIQWVKQ